jgi:perosamine synthetase
MFKIPVYQPALSGNEKKYVMECLDSTWVSSKGRFIAEFEEKFAEYTGVKYATTVSNGTVALHVALVALGIGAGDEVIVPTLTYIASVNAISYTGATPVFVDSLESTWQMDPEDVKRKITPRTRAIMVVHLYGHPCDMDSLVDIAERNNLFLIEDCAEALGSLYKDKYIGGFGNVATYSFFGNKTVTTGEGGMVVTNDKSIFEKVYRLKGQGLVPGREYWHDIIGYNYRMTNICAAIGLAQLEQVEHFLAQKRQIAQNYKKELTGLPVVFHNETSKVRHSYWMCSILVVDFKDRDLLRDALRASSIETRPVFFPVHTMPIYKRNKDSFPVSEDLGRRGINLPSWPGLTDGMVQYVCHLIARYFKLE